MYYCLFTKTDGTKDWISNDRYEELAEAITGRNDVESLEFGVHLSKFMKQNAELTQLRHSLLTMQKMINDCLE